MLNRVHLFGRLRQGFRSAVRCGLEILVQPTIRAVPMTRQRKLPVQAIRSSAIQWFPGHSRGLVWTLAVCIPACLSPAVSLRVSAQEVSGLVHITGTAAVARSAGVVLLDSAGTVRRGMLTGDDGRFSLRAPDAGRYRVLARQVGFSPDSSDEIELRRDQVAAVELSLKQFVLVLDSVEIVRKSRCAITPAAGSMALQLWEDVQSALTAAIITESIPRARDALLTRYTRQIDPASGRVVRAVSWQGVGLASEPFRALPADTLESRGFVVTEGRDIAYYAPDAHTILSDAFARTHCFRPAADARHPGLVGLAFAPTRSTKVGQVSGALWLDATSRELRYLEFKFSNPTSGNVASAGDSTDATGRIDYERLPWGGWIIARWIMRIPVVQMQTTSTVVTGATFALGTISPPTRTARVVSLWEIGGDARVAADSSAELAIGDGRGVIHGHVEHDADSTESQPLVKGIRVDLLPAAGVEQGGQKSTTAPIHSSVTDAQGRFSFDSVSAGDYTLRFTSTKFDTLAITVPDRPIHLERAKSLSASTVLPSAAVIMRTLCGSSAKPGDVALHGTVRDGKTGQPVAGATVRVRWASDANVDGAKVSAHEQGTATVTGPDGRYALCTAEQLHPMSVYASLGARSTGAVRVELSRDRIRMLDFVM